MNTETSYLITSADFTGNIELVYVNKLISLIKFNECNLKPYELQKIFIVLSACVTIESMLIQLKQYKHLTLSLSWKKEYSNPNKIEA